MKIKGHNFKTITKNKIYQCKNCNITFVKNINDYCDRLVDQEACINYEVSYWKGYNIPVGIENLLTCNEYIIKDIIE